MKHFISLLLMLSALTIKATAQVAPIPAQRAHSVFAPQTNTGWWNFTGGEYQNSAVFQGAEIATTRKYTVKGLQPIVIDTVNKGNDTINLLQANFGAGQIITIITTAANNDTLTITHDGSLNGATTAALISPATTASYKHTAIFTDGTNYWFK